MVKRLLILVLLLSWLPTGYAAELVATVDRTELLESEHVMLTLSLYDSDTRLRAEGLNPNVDLTVLNRDFEVGIPETDHRYTTRQGRGRSSSNLHVALFPKRRGTLTIPSFTVDGQMSQAISLTVHRATESPSPEVFIRSGSEKSVVWNREQTLVYLDLYHRVELKSARLGGHLDADPRDIELTSLPSSSRAETVNDIDYHVTRSAWLLAPQRSGEQHVTFPDVWIETADNRRLRLSFTETTLTVRPLPADVPPLVLIGRPRLAQTIDRNETVSGQLVTWEITLSAPTHITHLPDSLPGLVFPDSVQVYREPVRRTGADQNADAMSSALYRFVLTTSNAGQYQLPDITVPYFATDSGQLALMTLDGPVFTVAPGSPGNNTKQDKQSMIATQAPPGTAWMIAAIIFGLLWLGSMFFLWNSRRRASRPNKPDNPGASENISRPDSTDPKTRLLAAMGTRTLEEGARKWRPLVTGDEILQQTIRQLQQQHYAKDSNIDDSQLQHNVNHCIAQIRKQAARKTSATRWLPEHFLNEK